MNIETVSTALELYPETKAIILTYPNYYGLAEDLSPIMKLAHEKGIPVLVDEAHGAHLSLGDPFPKSAIHLGADVVVHSAHKTLPVMTMGSYLHVNSSLHWSRSAYNFTYKCYNRVVLLTRLWVHLT